MSYRKHICIHPNWNHVCIVPTHKGDHKATGLCRVNVKLENPPPLFDLDGENALR